MAMHRTQIYLEDSMYRLIRSRAREEGKTLAALIRELLSEALGGARAESDPLADVIGIAQGDGSAVAENHADYLYGDKS